MKVKKLNRLLILSLFLLSIPVSANAAQKSQAYTSDKRLRMYNYQPETVYEYTGHLRYASRIDFDPKEEILSMTMGDPTGWQMNPVGSRLFLKPIALDATTNLTIITNKRIYYFELYSREAESIEDPELVIAAKFNYGDTGGNSRDNKGFYDFSSQLEVKESTPDSKNPADAQNLNFNYTVNGAKYITPLEVFDDGEFTYFKFKDINAEYPAIFQVLPDGNEALINYRVTPDEYVVIEMVTSQFTLRFGQQVACIFNEAMPLERIKSKEEKEDEKSFLGVF